MCYLINDSIAKKFEVYCLLWLNYMKKILIHVLPYVVPKTWVSQVSKASCLVVYTKVWKFKQSWYCILNHQTCWAEEKFETYLKTSVGVSDWRWILGNRSFHITITHVFIHFFFVIFFFDCGWIVCSLAFVDCVVFLRWILDMKTAEMIIIWSSHYICNLYKGI